MQTEHLDRSIHEQIDHEALAGGEPSMNLRRFLQVLHDYRPVILLSLAGVVLAVLILAIALYLFAPAERITSQTFRLDFEGAGQGEYPNRTKFNIADIISGPIIRRVWTENQLGAYLEFGEFSRALFVLESNREYEEMALAYQAKLADPKLSPIDRERLQKEFEMKTESISKNEYSINLDRRAGMRTVPEPLARKILLDVLNDWADFAVNQQHVIAYQVSVLSPQILKPSPFEQNDLVAAIEVLRTNATRVADNISKMQKLPGALLARTPQDSLSLEEVRIRVEDTIRFRLEPLLASVLHNSGLIADRTATARFLESQLAYDQRQLEAAQRLSDSIRDSMNVYEQRTESLAGGIATRPAEPGKGDSVTPQLSDSFLDRLMSLTSRAADAKYRQNIVDEYRRATADTIPLKQAVAYDMSVLDEFRKSAGGTSGVNRASVATEIDQTRSDIGQSIAKMNDLFAIVSRNMTPSTQLFTLLGPPSTKTAHSVPLPRLALYAALVLLVSFPVIVALCFAHHRVREEEAEAAAALQPNEA
jgi:hypothetical protein